MFTGGGTRDKFPIVHMIMIKKKRENSDSSVFFWGAGGGGWCRDAGGEWKKLSR